MRAHKLLTFLIVFLAVLSCALLFSPSTYAREYQNEVHITGQLSGQYGAYVNGSYYRYQSYNSYSPVELLTGVSQRSKFLYGVSNGFSVSLDNKSNHYMQFGMKFSTNGADADFYNINEHYVGYKTSSSSSSYTEVDGVLCTVTTSQQVQIKYLDVVCNVTFTESVIPTNILYQYGKIGQFVHETDGPIAISTGSSIFLQDVWYKWSSANDSDNSAAINNLNNTMNDIHDDEKNTIYDSVDGASDDASSMSHNWSLANPLSGWLNLFTDSGCASIPTIKNWLHGVESQVCSPWDGSVRNTVTPVVSVLSTTIIFGLVIRWLKNSGSTK